MNLKIQLLGFFEIFGHPCPDIQGLAVSQKSTNFYCFLIKVEILKALIVSAVQNVKKNLKAAAFILRY